MSGKLLAIILVVLGLAAGGAMYYLQVYAYYYEVKLAGQGGDVTVGITRPDNEFVPIEVSGFEGIDSDSSPIRFRACFELDTDDVLEGADYPQAVPPVAPGWFDCFDAEAIGAALNEGRAFAMLGQENISYGIDRVLVVFPDGRAYAWTQINDCGKEVFDGNPPPLGCPLPPEGKS